MARMFPNWLQAYVGHTRFSESPGAFHFWTGVATIAGALRRKVYIDQRIFKWTPNFYIVLVGPPGIAAKSTSIRSGMGLLEAAAKKVPGIHFGPQSGTWQALVESLQKSAASVKLRSDSEPGGELMETMSCLTIGLSELGTFFNLDDSELVAVLIDMWDGADGTWRRSTKTQGDTAIDNPWLNVIGCTTPAWIKEKFPDVLIGGGLTSRIIFVFGNQKRQLVAYPAEMSPGEEYQLEEEGLIHDLIEIAQLKGEFHLQPEAIDWGRKWYEDHWTGPRPEHMNSDRFSGYIARKQVHLHKVAMVLSAAKRSDLEITREDLIEAHDCLTGIENDMTHVFSSIGVAQSAKVNGEVLTIIKNSRQIEYKKLWQMCFNTMAGTDFREAVKAAVEAGYVKVTKDGEKQILHYVDKRS